ncbi:MAG: hypothetical protein H0V12_02215 [Chloroflexi bacterium]|nr:hypothetical protein [Chloroflexota bacterium]
MYGKHSGRLAALLLIAGCSNPQPPADETQRGETGPTAPATATAVPDTSAANGHSAGDHGMAGMDHGAAPAGAAGSTSMEGMDHGAMAGMDHSRMGGMQHGQTQHAQTAQTPGMDHSRMGGMQHGQTQHGQTAQPRGMDHSSMPGIQHGTMNVRGGDGMRRDGAMPGMDHSRMDGMEQRPAGVPWDDAGMEKLLLLVAELVRDPAVQARIQADSVLRRRWEDEGLRRVLQSPAQPDPHAGHGRP